MGPGARGPGGGSPGKSLEKVSIPYHSDYINRCLVVCSIDLVHVLYRGCCVKVEKVSYVRV